MSRVLILGDIGAQIRVFENTLKAYGIDPDRPIIPDDTILVQVGDLVRRQIPGQALEDHHLNDEDNDKVVSLADRLLLLNPNNYFQLIGNHDALEIGGASPSNCFIRRPNETLNKWLSDGVFHLSITVETEEEDFLVTHAGLTHGYWKEIGSQASALDATKALNDLDVTKMTTDAWFFTNEHSLRADFIWALAASELYPSWRDELMPFSQIHGHSTVWQYAKENWADNAPDDVIKALTYIPEDRRFFYTQVDKVVHEVDWVLGDSKREETWPLLEFEGTVRL